MPSPRYRGAQAFAYPDRYLDPEGEGESIGVVGRRRYTASKLCNAVCTYELDRRLRAQRLSTPEAPIDANAFDPVPCPAPASRATTRPCPASRGTGGWGGSSRSSVAWAFRLALPKPRDGPWPAS